MTQSPSRSRFISTLLLLCLQAVPLAAAAATFTVTNEADLDTALASIADGDVIEIVDDVVITSRKTLPGTSIAYTINGNGYTISVPEPGLDEAGQVNPNASDHGLFIIPENDSPDITINDLTLIGGSPRLFFSSPNNTPVWADFSSNFLVAPGASVSFNRVLFTRNLNTDYQAPSGRGDGIGGALHVRGTVRFSESRFIRNQGQLEGGAIALAGPARVYIDRSTFVDNTSISSILASGGGGAINVANPSSSLYINNSTFANNRAEARGGAIRSQGGKIYVLNSTFTGNVGRWTGLQGDTPKPAGAIANESGSVLLYNSLFAYNYDPTAGGDQLADLSGTAEYYYSVTHGTKAPGAAETCDDTYGPTCDLDFGLGMCTESFVQEMCNKFCGLCTGGPAQVSGVKGHVAYNGAADGSDDTLFVGGSSESGVYRPLLVAAPGGTTSPLQKGSILADPANVGTRTRFNAATGVAAYFDIDTSAWVALPGASVGSDADEVKIDQVGGPRVLPARGATEAEAADLYIFTVLAPANGAADGSVSGGTVFGDAYTAGTDVTVTAFPASGKLFQGWADDSGATVSTDNPYAFTMPAANVTLQPVFEDGPPGQFTVTYLGNGNTGGDAPPVDTATGTTSIAPVGTLVREGFDFVDWNTRANGSGTDYAAGATYNPVPAANLTLYAKWQRTPPLLTAITPALGPTTGNTLVSLEGSGFFRPMTVTVGGQDCTDVTVTGPTEATCRTPVGSLGTVDVTVDTPFGSDTLANAYEYNDDPIAANLDIDVGGVAGGGTITIDGEWFVAGETTVTIDGQPCTDVKVLSPTQLTCTVPASTSGIGAKSVLASTPGGNPVTGAFTYTASPVLTAITPAQGAEGGGTKVTLTGANFGGGMIVDIGGNRCNSVQLIGQTQATCLAPSSGGIAGPVDVFVSVGGTQSNTLLGGFTYDDVPGLSAISPDQGPLGGGTKVTLTGSNFVPGATVSVGGTACAFVSVVNDTTITCNVPSGTTGAKNVVVTTAGGASPAVSYTYDDKPALTAISPTQGPQTGGTHIALTGRGFTSNMKVTVGGIACRALTVASATSASCETPQLSAGIHGVVVETAGGASNAQGFTMTASPIILGIAPAAGPVSGGTGITLSGASFEQGATVTVGGSACTPLQFVSDTEVSCTTPAGVAGAAVVELTTSGGAATGTFTYDDVPTLGGGATSPVNPAQVPLGGGTTITLTGTAFVPGATTVTIGGDPCSNVQVLSDTQLTCETPARTTAGVAEVVVETPGGSIGGVFITFEDVPTVASISPDGGQKKGGDLVTITGTGFVTGDTSVDIGTKACTNVTVVSSTKLTCTTPLENAGSVRVTVRTSGGDSVDQVNFTYYQEPLVDAVTPNEGPIAGGTDIKLTGYFFVPGETTVTIGGVPCALVGGATATELTCTTPAGTAGAAVLEVTTPGGSDTATFAYDPVPTVTAITPDQGPLAGGTQITLTGSGYDAGMTVTVGGQPCARLTVQIGGTEASCLVPPGSAGGASVVVTTPGGTSSGGPSFTYDNAPTIKVVKPTQGPTAGGGTLQLTGTSFLTSLTVTVGGQDCTSVNVASDTALSCTLPAGSAGSAAVVLTTPGGSANGQYIYDDVPTLTQIAPDQGPVSGFTEITLTGTGFIAGMGVTVGGQDCNGIVLVDQTTATCKTPPGSAGLAPVVVTTPGGTSASVDFGYDDQPTITGVNLRGEFKTAGGSEMVIDGTGFKQGLTQVTMGGQVCPVTLFSSDSQIRCRTPAGTVGPTTLAVTTPGGTASFPVSYVDRPTVTVIQPRFGPLAGGTPIRFIGDFSEQTTVLILGAGTCQNLQRVSASELTCVTPTATTAGVKRVLVANAAGPSLDRVFFTYEDQPAVTGISPDQGALAGGNTVTIDGSSFVAGDTTVSIGGAACTQVQILSDTQLTCTAPAGSAGSVPVTVTTSGGTSTDLVNYTYDDVPTVTGVSTPMVPTAGGTTITLTGTGFVPGLTSVSIGGVACTSVNVIDANTLTCVTGPSTAANTPSAIVVTTPGGGSSPNNAGATLTYNPRPLLKDVIPGSGPTSGGNILKLLGSGFVNGSTVIRIGGTDCTPLQYLTDTENRCTAPANTAGAKTVVMQVPGVGIDTGSYTYLAGPAVASVTPPAGPVTGGTPITVTGSGFVFGTTVTVGGNPCGSLNLQSDTTLSCVTPAGTAGIADVVVTNAGGTATGSFTYDDLPTISAITPNQGPVSGGTTITITGSGFGAGTTVTVAGNTCTALTILDQGTLTCVTPGGIAGTAVVALSNPGGTANGLFTYQDPNQPPVAADDAFWMVQDTVLTIDAPGVLDNDSDKESKKLFAVLLTQPSSGTLVLAADGSFVYTPNAGFTGADAFAYKANDGKTDSAPATVLITVTPASTNQPPVANDDAWAMAQDTVLSIDAPGVLANDSDPEQHKLRASSVQIQPSNGTLSLAADGSFVYTPDQGFSGTDSFAYRAGDGKDSSAPAMVQITVTQASTNQPPVANDDAWAMAQDTLLSIDAPGVLGNDSDPEGHKLRITILTQPANGLLAPALDGGFAYLPDPGFSGVDSFTYEVDDGKDSSAPAMVQITVTPASSNQPPVAVNDAYAMAQDTVLSIDAPGILGNDSDPEGHKLRPVVLTQPAHGHLAPALDGGFVYKPDPGFSGADQFTYQVDDGKADSNAATVQITVTPASTNQPPVANDDAYAMAQDTVLTIDAPGILGNDSDPEGHKLRITILSLPAHGLLAPSLDGGFAYLPDPGFSGVDAFTYEVDDGKADSNAATVQITVTPASSNQPPVANDDAYAMAQDTVLTIDAPGILANDSDPEGHKLRLTVLIPPANGLLAPALDGGFSYLPDIGFSGFDSFTYQVDDGKINSGPATVWISVSATNNPPVANDDAYFTVQDVLLDVSAPGLLANDSDPEGHALKVTIVSQPAHGLLAPAGDGGFAYLPDPGYFGLDAFTYTVSDGKLSSAPATVQITVTGLNVNQPPVANDDAYFTVQDLFFEVSAPGVLANDSDPEGHQLKVTIQSQPANGVLAPTADGGFIYVPKDGYFGVDSFTYTVSDGKLSSNTATVQITVTGLLTNQPPVANDDAYFMVQDTLLNVAAPGVLANDSDPEGHPLKVTIVAPPAHGLLAPAGDGGFAYLPDPGYFGVDSFTYTVSDGKLSSNTATVSIEVLQAPAEPAIPIPTLNWAGLLALITLMFGTAFVFTRRYG